MALIPRPWPFEAPGFEELYGLRPGWPLRRLEEEDLPPPFRLEKLDLPLFF